MRENKVKRKEPEMVPPVTETGSRTDWGVSLFLEMSVQFSSVAQLCLTLCDPWTAAHQASLSITNSWSLFKLMYHLVLCHPLLLLPSSFPSIRVFSNESVLYIRLPKYWSFSFSTGLSNEYSGLISFRDADISSKIPSSIVPSSASY